MLPLLDQSMNYLDLLRNWFANFFEGFLPTSVKFSFFFLKYILKVILRIFTTYLNEGIIVFYKIAYVLLIGLEVYVNSFLI